MDSHAATRPALVPLSWLYGGVVRCRNRYYDGARYAVRSAGVPVISVGNITVGGTGKTPLVIEIVRRLRSAGRRPAILTRGYAARPGEVADEVLEFSLAVPDVPVVANPDRVAGAATACREHAADCLVLDDGFQHRRLRRDLDVVLIDALDPWGGGWLLPAGRLREPLRGLRRAGRIVVTRCNQVDSEELEETIQALRHHAPDTPVSRAVVEPERLVGLSGDAPPLETLAERCVLPVCGIGNPATFVGLLRRLAPRACEPVIFPDHQQYGAAQVQGIIGRAAECGAAGVVTTRKDWVKLSAVWPRAGGGPAVDLWRLDVRLALADPRGEFDARLRGLFEGRT